MCSFSRGCPHHCRGCQNPETWDPAGGTLRDTEEIAREIRNTRYLDGITLSGGDPLMQASACRALLEELGLPCWLYTGYTWEQIQAGEAGPEAVMLLPYLEVLVDGPFIEERLSDTAIWRGSDNQRLIDVGASLKEGSLRLWSDRG